MSLIGWEIWSYVQAPLIWFLFKKFAKKNIAGELMAGTILGAYLEFSTEPLWTYHFRIKLHYDICPGVVLSWGVMFALVILVSDKMYRWCFKTITADYSDKRILIFDMISGILIGFPSETIGVKAGIWDYHNDILKWNWGNVPLFNMPYEALLGYTLLMLVAPTYVRHWKNLFIKEKLV